MNQVAANLSKIKSALPQECTLVAVSKTKPISDIESAYGIGHRDFGENKVQELADKAAVLPNDIKWHMIGHLQRNKVKFIAPFVHLIHGVDSLKLLKEINKRAATEQRVIRCLLQVHIAEEDSKFGFNESELLDMIDQNEFASLRNIVVVGLMGMATYTDDTNQIKSEFKSLSKLYEKLKEHHTGNLQISTLSMGMSGDYQLALEEGSNMVRIGSAIFGKRN